MQASVMDDIAMKRMASCNHSYVHSNDLISKTRNRILAQPSARSWGEQLQTYKANSTKVPWKAEEREPVQVVTRYQMSRDERDFDPVAGKFRDRERERQYKREERATALLQLQEGKEKQMSYTQTFDIVNHKSKLKQGRRDGPLPVARKPMPDSRSSYNIVSNKGPLPEGQSEGRHHSHEDPNEVDFNVVSNKYLSNHDEKQAMDNEAMKHLAAEKFWKSHNYDAVAGVFYDPAKEADYHGAVRDKERTQGQTQRARLPRSHQYSEGALYDPINLDMRDEERFAEVEAVGDRTVAKIKRTKVEASTKVRSDHFDAMMSGRARNRISHARAEERVAHGYNVLTNEVNPRGVMRATLRQNTAFERTVGGGFSARSGNAPRNRTAEMATGNLRYDGASAGPQGTAGGCDPRSARQQLGLQRTVTGALPRGMNGTARNQGGSARAAAAGGASGRGSARGAGAPMLGTHSSARAMSTRRQQQAGQIPSARRSGRPGGNQSARSEMSTARSAQGWGGGGGVVSRPPPVPALPLPEGGMVAGELPM